MMVKIMHQSMKYIKCVCSRPEIAASVKKIATGLVHNWARDLLLRLELCRPIKWKGTAIS